MSKHTPGRWIVDDRHVHCQDGLTYPYGQEPETDIIVEVNTDCHDNGLLNEMDKANLRLIAAAPDLFGACKLCVARLEEYGDAESGIALELARTAIAKAQGD